MTKLTQILLILYIVSIPSSFLLLIKHYESKYRYTNKDYLLCWILSFLPIVNIASIIFCCIIFIEINVDKIRWYNEFTEWLDKEKRN